MNRYLAFISYRHLDADQKVSAALMKGIEGWHLPKDCPLPRRRRVFRDTDELPTGSDLGTDIENALRDSDFLITLCSEDYMTSLWCLREVELFLEMGRKDRILPVLMSGTPERSIPPEIQDIPVAADLRDGFGKLDLRKAKAAVPQLLSRMSGMEEAQIASAQRGFRLMSAGGAAGLLLAGILGFAGYAMHTADLIEQLNTEIAAATEMTQKARAQAIRERNEASLKNAQFMAEQAMIAYNAGNTDEAVRLALSALPEDLHGDEPVSVEALGALRMAMSRPRLRYSHTYSVETDFEITGCERHSPYELMLKQEDHPESEFFLSYDSGELVEEENSIREKALEEGYSLGDVIHREHASKSAWYRLYHGPEKQLQTSVGYRGRMMISLDGEPFYSDSYLQESYGEKVFVWLEHPLEGQKSRAAIVDMEEGTAAEIKMDGTPLAAEFSGDLVRHIELAVVDRKGKLRIYDTATGALRTEMPGSWSQVHYPAEAYRICAAAADGSGWSLLSTGTGEELLKVETPSPVRDMDYCQYRSALLVHCDDGVRIYELESGRLLTFIETEESPLAAVWGHVMEGEFRHQGNMIAILYPHRVEIWSLVTDVDTAATDVIPLYKDELANSCEYAFYSYDGKKIFLQMRNGDISAWDARTGEFFWVNPGDWNVSGSHTDTVLSEDGGIVWRKDQGLTRIDPETGETAYVFKTNGNSYTPVMSPDKTLAVLPGISWSGMKGFDPETGELLWENDGETGRILFSEDGKSLLYLDLEEDTEIYAQNVIWRRLDPRTGSMLEEKQILQRPIKEENKYWNSVRVDPKQRLGVICVSAPYSYAGDTILLIDMDTGTLSDEITVPGDNTELVFTDDGKLALQWKEEGKSGYEWCCSLQKDGQMGEVLSFFSEAGRRLVAGKTQLVRFAGEEALLNAIQIDRDVLYHTQDAHELKRLSDDALLLDSGDCLIAATPAGGSVCIYSTKTTPLLLLDSDPDTLVQKAHRYLEGQP